MNNVPHPHPDTGSEADVDQEDIDHLTDPDDDNNEDEPGCTGKPLASGDESNLGDLLWIVAWVGSMCVMLTAPMWIWMLVHWGDSTAPIPQGTVQKILFVGSFGVNSQVDTEQRSFLVRGVTTLHRGAQVELRKSTWAMQLCDVDSRVCEDLMKDE